MITYTEFVSLVSENRVYHPPKREKRGYSGDKENYRDILRRMPDKERKKFVYDVAYMVREVVGIFKRNGIKAEIDDHDHIIKRILQRNHKPQDVTMLFKLLEKERDFFTPEHIEHNKGKKIHILYPKKEIHVVLKIEDSGKVIFKTIMENFTRNYITGQRERKYYV